MERVRITVARASASLSLDISPLPTAARHKQGQSPPRHASLQLAHVRTAPANFGGTRGIRGGQDVRHALLGPSNARNWRCKHEQVLPRLAQVLAAKERRLQVFGRRHQGAERTAEGPAVPVVRQATRKPYSFPRVRLEAEEQSSTSASKSVSRLASWARSCSRAQAPAHVLTPVTTVRAIVILQRPQDFPLTCLRAHPGGPLCAQAQNRLEHLNVCCLHGPLHGPGPQAR